MKNLLLLSTIFLYFYSSSQDAIFLKSGDELKCQVIKVGVNEVEYKKDSTSPVYAIKKSEVFMIKYKDGSKDVLTSLAKIEPQKESFQSFRLKYGKYKRAGIGLLIAGGLCFFGGAGISPVGDDAALVVGLSLMGASLPLIISGGVMAHKYVKYKRQWKEQQRAVSFAPNGISLTF